MFASTCGTSVSGFDVVILEYYRNSRGNIMEAEYIGINTEETDGKSLLMSGHDAEVGRWGSK